MSCHSIGNRKKERMNNVKAEKEISKQMWRTVDCSLHPPFMALSICSVALVSLLYFTRCAVYVCCVLISTSLFQYCAIGQYLSLSLTPSPVSLSLSLALSHCLSLPLPVCLSLSLSLSLWLSLSSLSLCLTLSLPRLQVEVQMKEKAEKELSAFKEVGSPPVSLSAPLFYYMVYSLHCVLWDIYLHQTLSMSVSSFQISNLLSIQG